MPFILPLEQGASSDSSCTSLKTRRNGVVDEIRIQAPLKSHARCCPLHQPSCKTGTWSVRLGNQRRPDVMLPISLPCATCPGQPQQVASFEKDRWEQNLADLTSLLYHMHLQAGLFYIFHIFFHGNTPFFDYAHKGAVFIISPTEIHKNTQVFMCQVAGPE